MPRPPISGIQFLAFPALAAIVGVLVLLLLSVRTSLPMPVLRLILLLLIASIMTGVSFVLNSAEVRPAAVGELFRPTLFVIFLLYGYLIAARFGELHVRRGIILAAYFILSGQLVLTVTQMAGVPIFEPVYASDKGYEFGSLLRTTGTLANPNAFAWVVAQATIWIVVLKERWYLPWAFLGFALVLVSGSRTLVLLFPAMLGAAVLWSSGSGWKGYLRGIGLAIFILAAVVGIIFTFSTYFGYLAELREVLFRGSLLTIDSFASRVRNWGHIFGVFADGGARVWLFGLGSRELTQVLDNDFLFVLTRLGLAGLAVHLIVIIYTAVLLHGNRFRDIAVLGLVYLVFSVVLGLVFETLGGWNFPLLMFFLLGLTLGLASRDQFSSLLSRSPAFRLGAGCME